MHRNAGITSFRLIKSFIFSNGITLKPLDSHLMEIFENFLGVFRHPHPPRLHMHYIVQNPTTWKLNSVFLDNVILLGIPAFPSPRHICIIYSM